MIKMNVKGAENVVFQLRHTAKVVEDRARKTMHRAADRIVREARLNAPVDRHNLEKSIRKEKSYGYRGRLQIDVVMGGIVDGVNVDNYATEMHENYDDYEPGEATKMKQAQHPERIVGGKFLERAADVERRKLQPTMLEMITSTLREIWGRFTR